MALLAAFSYEKQIGGVIDLEGALLPASNKHLSIFVYASYADTIVRYEQIMASMFLLQRRIILHFILTKKLDIPLSHNWWEK